LIFLYFVDLHVPESEYVPLSCSKLEFPVIERILLYSCRDNHCRTFTSRVAQG
jgi:hypothetical protein